MKIALLCNNRLALLALQKLAAANAVCAVGIADTQQEVKTLVSAKAKELKLPLTIFTKKDHNGQLKNWLADCQPDVVFVITFPWRIGAEVLAMPRLGVLNFHYGLLPEMRGSDPIYETILQQRSVAGVTVHRMDEGLDTGPVILREEIEVAPHYTYGMLGNQLAYTGADMALKVMNLAKDGALPEGTVQDEAKAQYWPAKGAEDIFIKWRDMDSQTIIALVNACNPVLRSGAATYINGWGIGICFASPVTLTGNTDSYEPGVILALDYQNGLIVYCRDRKGVKLEVIYTEEGFFPGYMMSLFGINKGMTFN